MGIKQKVLVGLAGAMIVTSGLAIPSPAMAATVDAGVVPVNDVDSSYGFNFDG